VSFPRALPSAPAAAVSLALAAALALIAGIAVSGCGLQDILDDTASSDGSGSADPAREIEEPAEAEAPPADETAASPPQPGDVEPDAAAEAGARLEVGYDSFAELAHDADGVAVNGQSRGVLQTANGWTLPILKATPHGWIVWTPCARAVEVSEGWIVPTADFVIDPGHGGPTEPGAVGAGGLTESQLNFEVALRIRKRLIDAGYTAVLTRHDDVRVPIATRAEIARALSPKAFISVHFNAGTTASSPTPGTEMYHQLKSADSRRLAGLLYEETVAALEQYPTSWVALSDAGVLVRPNSEGGDYYGVLRRPGPVTSVLAEFGYLSNPAEEQLFARPEVQEALAAATAGAVDRFVNSADPGSGFVAEEDIIFRGYGPSGAGRTDNCTDPEFP